MKIKKSLFDLLKHIIFSRMFNKVLRIKLKYWCFKEGKTDNIKQRLSLKSIIIVVSNLPIELQNVENKLKLKTKDERETNIRIKKKRKEKKREEMFSRCCHGKIFYVLTLFSFLATIATKCFSKNGYNKLPPRTLITQSDPFLW